MQIDKHLQPSQINGAISESRVKEQRQKSGNHRMSLSVKRLNEIPSWGNKTQKFNMTISNKH